MKILKMVTAGVVGLSISASGTCGEYIDQVKAQLTLIQLAASSEGWEETHNAKFDKLDNEDYDSFSFTLRKGLSYRVISVCDEDCSDLDLILYDENDNEIGKDTSTDSMPIVEANPKWSGKFTLKVKMYSCSDNPCYYGINILGK